MKLIEIRQNVWLNTDKVLAVYLQKTEHGWQYIFDLGAGEEKEKSDFFRTEDEAREWFFGVIGK